MKADFDIAVVGSGFGGSLMAMIARRLGRSVVLLERGRHPRFAIGESSTPLANLLLEELADRYDLPRLRPLAKWASWQKTYPQIACGLKRGFTFFHHRLGRPFAADPARNDQLLVAASPRDEMGDTHWYRADFDAFLVGEAQSLGAEYVDRVTLDGVFIGNDGLRIEGKHAGRRILLRARFLVDASGPRGFMHRALGLAESPVTLPTEGLYTHFTGVRRWEELAAVRPGGAKAETPPYPVDDAAMHHVFDGGWIWVLRFNNGVTSAGVAADADLAGELGLGEGPGAWSRLLDRLPPGREQFRDARAVTAFAHARSLSFRSAAAAGARWALLPSAAGFADPLLSTGFPLTLLGVGRLAEILATGWESPVLEPMLGDYARQTFEELDAAALLVKALYASMDDFQIFSGLSLLYFAAASFAETARRLDRPQSAPGFLLHRHARFGPRLRRLCERAARARENPGSTAAARAGLRDEILRAIEPIDVAGLSDGSRRSWYPVLADDLLNSAHKLGARPDEMRRMLARCGFPVDSAAGP